MQVEWKDTERMFLRDITENCWVMLEGDPTVYIVRHSYPKHYLKGSSLPTTLTLADDVVLLWPRGQWEMQTADGQGLYGQPKLVHESIEVGLV